MDVEINYCNNIDKAKILISEGKLNIKFAPNGTGKSTIARAIQYSQTQNQQSLQLLLPFKFRTNNPDNIQPLVTGTEALSQVMCFNEEYVSQFTFQPDELVSNSFDILIKNDAYRETEREIEEIIITIRQVFTDNPDLETLLSNLQVLADAFKLTKAGLSKSTTGMKGLSSGNKIKHIPLGLESYKPFIQSDKSVDWISWQTKGHEDFSALSDNCCPFCTSDASVKKEQIQKVSQEYDKAVIKNLIGIINVVKSLGEYFSEAARENLATITNLENGLENQHETYIITIKSQTDDLIKKLNTLKMLSGFHFEEGENVAEKLASYILDLNFFTELQSTKTQETVDKINSSLSGLIVHAGKLQGKINQQRSKIKKLIEKHKKDINNFLSYAGYRYRVQIIGDSMQSWLKLQHVDHDEFVSGGSQHLSYGERNAFAIVLFMYECLAKNPGLIILDDPISSFDKNKKFAILEMLFRRDSKDCLKGKTVLMLTHDVEPIIDTLKSVKNQFSNQVSASYLRLDNDQICEQRISENDIKTFAQICQSVTDSEYNDIIKLIYLRRHYEILDDKGDAYQVLSNILHKREKPTDSREPQDQNRQHPEMDSLRVIKGCGEISERISTFNYTRIHAELSDDENIRALYRSCQSGYEKLQVFRLFDMDVKNSVIQKFINETYHIENEFICQLDPTHFDFIPAYVIKECDKIVFSESTEPVL
ncbi:AAA family ATPase [Yersinia alsatica]|uniref:AAA family ATPase n=1 Tax=Yersinia alsatica TaxID=2890317 RepID=A0ABY5UJ77_9GAMM|nr:AAA family ATPase [Yersinia alsatica]OWF69075.1 AAA family ATPase [Yersinia frederiksenii]UWM43559.1 AAA family ATPase [Yersinia alsatica]CNK68189.1 cobalt transporter ATP-binding subunit [Yersinia frederiksenii]CNL54195.1 cobalt transporter ATP-binding subunit [Yersinia frederiksenii]